VGEERHLFGGRVQRRPGVLEAQLPEPGPPSTGLQSKDYNVAH